MRNEPTACLGIEAFIASKLKPDNPRQGRSLGARLTPHPCLVSSNTGGEAGVERVLPRNLPTRAKPGDQACPAQDYRAEFADTISYPLPLPSLGPREPGAISGDIAARGLPTGGSSLTDFAARVNLESIYRCFGYRRPIFNQALDVRPRLLQGIAHRGYI